MDPVVVAAGIGLVGTLIVSYAAVKSRNAERNTRNGRGTVVDIVESIEDKVDEVTYWMVRHNQHHQDLNLSDRVEELEDE